VRARGLLAATMTADQSQGPYDGSDDTMVGVINLSPVPVQSVALSGSGTFGFDTDCLCTDSWSSRTSGSGLRHAADNRTDGEATVCGFARDSQWRVRRFSHWKPVIQLAMIRAQGRTTLRGEPDRLPASDSLLITATSGHLLGSSVAAQLPTKEGQRDGDD